MEGRSTRSKGATLETGLEFYRPSSSKDNRPDLYELYKNLDVRYFNGELKRAGFTVDWGQNMRRTSGFTDTKKRYIRISWEIHSLLPEEDLMATLLHEMIHVKCFQHKWDASSHWHCGKFVEEMERINKIGPYKVVLSHELPEKVYEKLHPHEWKCRSCGYIIQLTTRTIPASWLIFEVDLPDVTDDQQCRVALWYTLENWAVPSPDRIFLGIGFEDQ
ncbi:DNA-dependent metalloprotease SPRTN-like [Leptopilina boulardi]|uniref:DNA-dependent metalloprotease SPRTN-like n=1 Tax=Leptopilina boulardi TaxID=63433 RepID=UPI0021F5FFCE|nr:DNA-dependent metalloprotease SPRTN-like [Leptopilina boulardi]